MDVWTRGVAAVNAGERRPVRWTYLPVLPGIRVAAILTAVTTAAVLACVLSTDLIVAHTAAPRRGSEVISGTFRPHQTADYAPTGWTVAPQTPQAR